MYYHIKFSGYKTCSDNNLSHISEELKALSNTHLFIYLFFNYLFIYSSIYLFIFLFHKMYYHIKFSGYKTYSENNLSHISEGLKPLSNTHLFIYCFSIIYLFIHFFIYLSIFNVDTSFHFLHVFVTLKRVKRFNYQKINQYNSHKEQKF